MAKFALIAAVSTIVLAAPPAVADITPDLREQAKVFCVSRLTPQSQTGDANKKVDPTVVCDSIDRILAPPTYPKITTVSRIIYSNEPSFFDGLRRMLNYNQNRNQEVWVDFQKQDKPVLLSSLDRIGPESGDVENGLMTWISKSKSYRNQFCRLSNAQSSSDKKSLGQAAIDGAISLFNSLIAKWQAINYYRPARRYSIVAVYSSDPAENQRLVTMRFVPSNNLKKNCGGFVVEKKPLTLGDEPEMPKQ